MVYKISIVQCIITCNFNLLLPKWFLSLNFFFIFPLFLTFSFQVLNGFPICSPRVFPMCSPRVFPIAPHFNPTCFAQSPPLLTYVGGPKGEEALQLATNLLFWGASIVSTLFCNGPIQKNKVGLVSHPPTNLSMKEGSLFCFAAMRSTK
jgi:hypothetical protein